MGEYECSDAVQSLVRPEVLGLPAYDPGADPDAVGRQYGLERVIKLSNNENPYGMSPFAAQALGRRLALGLGRYPDPAGKDLCSVLADRHGTRCDHVILGNGSENILELLCQAFIRPGERVVTQAPCFGLHEIFPLMMGGQVTKVPVTGSFACDLPAWRQTLDQPAKMVLISNPSNPVGSAFTWAELEAIVHATPLDCLLVIDEAYFEYAIGDPSYPDALRLLNTLQRPWIVLRTFSKAHGLASLRVGYGVASHAGLIDALHRVRTPYNVNQLAQEAAIAALEDVQHLVTSVALVRGEQARLSEALAQAGLGSRHRSPISCSSIPAWMRRRWSSACCEGVIVKAWRESGYRTFIRASLSLPADNDMFLKALLGSLCQP